MSVWSFAKNNSEIQNLIEHRCTKGWVMLVYVVMLILKGMLSWWPPQDSKRHQGKLSSGFFPCILCLFSSVLPSLTSIQFHSCLCFLGQRCGRRGFKTLIFCLLLPFKNVLQVFRLGCSVKTVFAKGTWNWEAGDGNAVLRVIPFFCLPRK